MEKIKRLQIRLTGAHLLRPVNIQEKIITIKDNGILFGLLKMF